MTDRLTFTLWNPQQAHASLMEALQWAKSMLMAGHRLVLEIRLEGKTRPQEKKYHAQIGDIARQVMLGDRFWPDEDAKRILVSAFREDTKADPDLAPHWATFGQWQLVPGLRGEFVVTGIPTRKFPKPLASAFIEWLYAFGAEHGVKWGMDAAKIDAETGEVMDAA